MGADNVLRGLVVVFLAATGTLGQETPGPMSMAATGLQSNQIVSSASNKPPMRDQQAMSVLAGAIAAMGGSVSASQSSSVVARGNVTVPHGAVSGAILWENAGTEFRYEYPGPNGPIIFVSGHGNPAIVEKNKIKRNVLSVAMTTFPWHLPWVVLSSRLSNANIQINNTEAVTISGISALKISTTDESDDFSAAICKQDWYFDLRTFLPIKVEYLGSDIVNPLRTVQMTTSFSDYRSVSGTVLPFHLVTSIDGMQVADIVLSSVELTNSIQTSDFDVVTAISGGAN